MVATPEDHSTGYAPTPVLTVPRVATRPHRPLSDPFDRPVAMPLNSSPIPGFSAEQVRSITKLIEDVLDKALDKRFGPLQPQQKQSVIMPKPAQQEQEQEHRPLQQANVEKIAEKTVEKNTENIAEKQSIASSSSPIQAGTLSTIPHQATMHNCGEPSPRLSSTPLSTSLLASQLASPLGYIRFAKDMEAIGQG
ncbi:hypothetical protein HO133_003763 [Letharia lupina]|uniref:Uncharacterized protein n=1 Tax=Letharia lupina TaxID=560253 RepID=A0A8H6CAU3_9LECA|nr:uncharacterized protein HO133_003763 [Letharia lupina]KAF6219938.1 hypothetical protein HO133_003763 [Letharia lupina]